MQVNASIPSFTLGGSSGSIAGGAITGDGLTGQGGGLEGGALGFFDLLLGLALGGATQAGPEGETQQTAPLTTAELAAPAAEAALSHKPDAIDSEIEASAEWIVASTAVAPIQSSEIEPDTESQMIAALEHEPGEDATEPDTALTMQAMAAAAATVARVSPSKEAPETSDAQLTEQPPIAAKTARSVKAAATPQSPQATDAASASTQQAWNVRDLALGIDQAINQLQPQADAAEPATAVEHMPLADESPALSSALLQQAKALAAGGKQPSSVAPAGSAPTAAETSEAANPTPAKASSAPTQSPAAQQASAASGHALRHPAIDSAKADSAAAAADTPSPEGAVVADSVGQAPKTTTVKPSAEPTSAQLQAPLQSTAQATTGDAVQPIEGLDELFQSGQVNRGTWSATALEPVEGRAQADPVPFADQLREATRYLASQTEGTIRMGDKGVEAQLRLSPPELGDVQVHLTVGNDLTVRAEFIAERGETVRLIQNHLDQFKQVMGQHGLVVDRVQVNVTPGAASSGALPDSGGSQQGQGDPRFENRAGERRGQEQSRGQRQRPQQQEQE